jgi:hypothetical protein
VQWYWDLSFTGLVSREKKADERTSWGESVAGVHPRLAVSGEQIFTSFKMPDSVINGVHERRDKCTRQMHLSNSQACRDHIQLG